MSKQSISLLKMDEPKRLRAQCISEHCTEKISKRRYSKTTVNPNKGKTSKPLVDEGAIIAGLVETNQLLTNVNKLIEASISTDKVQLIELQKYSLLFTVIDLSILSDAFSLCVFLYFQLAWQQILVSCKLLNIEDKKKGLAIYAN